MVRIEEIESAYAVVSEFVRRTPVMTTPTITGLCLGDDDPKNDTGRLLLKTENLQKTGAFKIRGAYWRLSQLTAEEKSKGVVCASAGNHAQGIALAAKELGIGAKVFMPETASIAKIRATQSYGADVILTGRSYDESALAAKEFEKRSHAVFVSAYDDDGIICGQGTLGIELLRDVPDLDCVVVPIGGGGLFAGIARAIKSKKPSVRVIGVQAEGADAAVQSYKKGELVERAEPVSTICDGIAVKSPSMRTFEYIRDLADDVVTVTDSSVASALLLLVERMKLVVEPSGAAALAALLSHRIPLVGNTGVILSGGNIDLKLMADLIEREMLKAQRYVHLFTAVVDKPGTLAKLVETVAAQQGNILTVIHNRISPSIPLGSTGVELLIEVRGPEHRDRIIEALQDDGYATSMLD